MYSRSKFCPQKTPIVDVICEYISLEISDKTILDFSKKYENQQDTESQTAAIFLFFSRMCFVAREPIVFTETYHMSYMSTSAAPAQAKRLRSDVMSFVSCSPS